MDFLKDTISKATGGGNQQGEGHAQNQGQGQGESGQGGKGGGFLSGIGDKLNSAAGGGRESEKNEDYLDKGTVPPIPLPKHGTNTRIRCRLRPGEVHGPRPAGQRVGCRAGEG